MIEKRDADSTAFFLRKIECELLPDLKTFDGIPLILVASRLRHLAALIERELKVRSAQLAADGSSRGNRK